MRKFHFFLNCIKSTFSAIFKNVFVLLFFLFICNIIKMLKDKEIVTCVKGLFKKGLCLKINILTFFIKKL